MSEMLNISPMGVQILAMHMLVNQLDECRAALADDCEMVTLGDGKLHDAIGELRRTAHSLTKVANEIVAMTAADIIELPPRAR